MSSDLSRRTWGPHDHATADEQIKASRYVASIAHDKTDCSHLLDVLGLLPALAVVEHGMPGYRAGCRCQTCRRANANRNRRQRAAIPGTTTADAPINTRTRSVS